MEERSIFRQESLDRMSSPEQLDGYIHVLKPSFLIAIAAILVLAVSVCVWGFTGTIPNTISASGYMDTEGNVTCYVSPDMLPANITGHDATVTLPDGSKLETTVASVSPVPYSTQEIQEQVQSDWITASVLSGDYSYVIQLVPVVPPANLSTDVLVNVTLIVSEIKPIQLITG